MVAQTAGNTSLPPPCNLTNNKVLVRYTKTHQDTPRFSTAEFNIVDKGSADAHGLEMRFREMCGLGNTPERWNTKAETQTTHRRIALATAGTKG